MALVAVGLICIAILFVQAPLNRGQDVSALSETLCHAIGNDYKINCGMEGNLSGCHYFLKGKTNIITGEVKKSTTTVNIPNIENYEAIILKGNFKYYYRKKFSAEDIEDCSSDTWSSFPRYWYLLILVIPVVLVVTTFIILKGYYCRLKVDEPDHKPARKSRHWFNKYPNDVIREPGDEDEYFEKSLSSAIYNYWSNDGILKKSVATQIPADSTLGPLMVQKPSRKILVTAEISGETLICEPDQYGFFSVPVTEHMITKSHSQESFFGISPAPLPKKCDEVLKYASNYIQVVDVGTQYEYPCTDQIQPGCAEIAINMEDEFEVVVDEVKESASKTLEL